MAAEHEVAGAIPISGDLTTMAAEEKDIPAKSLACMLKKPKHSKFIADSFTMAALNNQSKSNQGRRAKPLGLLRFHLRVFQICLH